MAEKVQFRPGELLKELKLRGGSEGYIAKRDLERYYFMIRESQPSGFTVNEMLAIISSLSTPAYSETPTPATIKKYLWAEIIEGADSCQDFDIDYEQQYQVDMDKLAKKVKKLSLAETFALQDLAERVWTDWSDTALVPDSPDEPETASLARHWRWYHRAKALETSPKGKLQEQKEGEAEEHDHPW